MNRIFTKKDLDFFIDGYKAQPIQFIIFNVKGHALECLKKEIPIGEVFQQRKRNEKALQEHFNDVVDHYIANGDRLITVVREEVEEYIEKLFRYIKFYKSLARKERKIIQKPIRKAKVIFYQHRREERRNRKRRHALKPKRQTF